MEFTIEFLKVFGFGLSYATPILLFLILVISIIGILVGKKEQWSIVDSLYFAFITATTVGYGDFRPGQRSGKVLALVIAFAGLLLTGIIVAIGVKAASVAFQHIHDISSLQIPVK